MSEQDRVMELEIKLSFQENLIAELDGVVQRLAGQVDALRRETKELREQVQEALPAPVDERPPHY